MLNYIEEANYKKQLKLSYKPVYELNDNDILVGYNNCRSLKRHFLDISTNYNLLVCDIIFLSETRLSLHDVSNTFEINDYNLYRLDQKGTDSYHGIIGYV